MNSLPVLHTRRLRLFVAGPETAEACARFNRENAEFLAPWEPRMSARSFAPKELREHRERAVAAALAGTAYSFAIDAGTTNSNMTIVGWLNFSNIIRGVFQACNMGYTLSEHAQHRGFMTEAGRAGTMIAAAPFFAD